MDIEKFFLEENKNGRKTVEKCLMKSHPSLCDEIKIFSKQNNLVNLSFKEEVYHFIHKLKEVPQCANSECNKKLIFKRSLNEGYGVYCSLPCTNKCENHIGTVKLTNNEKYGGNAPLCSEEIKDKVKKTNLERYGVENIFEDNEYIKKKTLEKLGVDSPLKLQSIKDRVVATNMKKFGVSTPILLSSSRNKWRELAKNNFIESHPDLKIININKDIITIECNICNNIYEIDRSVLRGRLETTTNPCIICHPIKDGVSIAEKELREFIDSLNLNIIPNNRSILDGQELDIYLPDLNIAIEYNGLIWHSEKYVEDDYHSEKTKGCKEKNINLIHIFEDEWNYKKEIVQGKLRSDLNKNISQILSEDCEIKEVSNVELNSFVNKNCFISGDTAGIKSGLYHGDELISVLQLKLLSPNKYEILKFTNKLNINIVGSLKKLLNDFIQKYCPRKILKNEDIRWSDIYLYSDFDFKLIKYSSPDYWYMTNRHKHHKSKYVKDILIKDGYNKNKSEHEIMFERKIYRIYDCGQNLYELDLNKSTSPKK